MTNRSIDGRRVLVTGGCGFIGSHLADRLVNDARCEVLNLDVLTYAGSIENNECVANNDNYNWKRLNICNHHEVRTSVEEFKPDLIFHLAAESHVDRSIDRSSDFIDTNVLGTHVLLESFRSYAENYEGSLESPIFFHVSTDEVYGDLKHSDPPFKEDSQYRPSSPYSATKAASDHLVKAWSRTYGISTLISNCSNNFGPRQASEKLIPTVIKAALAAEQIPVYGAGNQIRDWLYVADHVDGLLSIAEKGSLNETYNIGARNEINNLRLVNSICDMLDEKVRPENPRLTSHRDLIAHVSDRPGHDFRYAIDPAKLQKDTDWKPKSNFEDALRNTIYWYLDRWCRG